jgi:manganese/zinc/iron transport system permease protein
MVVLAAAIGALAGVIGAVVSSAAARMPTGPTIVVAVSFLVVVSFLLAPNRGLVWGWARDRRARRRLRLDTVLADLHALAAQHGSLDHGHAAAVVSVMEGGRDVEGSLGGLEARGCGRGASRPTSGR